MKLFKNPNFYRFLIPSMIGAFLFVTPINQDGNLTIPVAVAANGLLDLMGSYSLTVIWGLISLSALITVIHRITPLAFVARDAKLAALFGVRGFWFWVRMTGALFANMIYFGIGPDWIIGDLTGGLGFGALLRRSRGFRRFR
jgi:nucleoside recognition membrane protein YjiH